MKIHVLKEMLYAILQNDSRVNGMTAAFEPGKFDPNVRVSPKRNYFPFCFSFSKLIVDALVLGFGAWLWVFCIVIRMWLLTCTVTPLTPTKFI
jgi:hypothetical protein